MTLFFGPHSALAPALPRNPFVSLSGLGTTLSPSQSQIVQMVTQAANTYGVPVNLALGIAAHESNFNPNATNVNANGTIDYGVMQLNTTTVKTLGVSDPMDPQQNINAGVGLLATYLQKYNGNQTDALWAYASGPGAVAGGNMNSTAQKFSDYVQTYDAAPVLSAAGVDAGAVGNTATDIVNNDASLFSGIDFTDPATIAVTAAAGLALLWLSGRG